MVVVDEDGVLARWADWQARSKQVPVGAISDGRDEPMMFVANEVRIRGAVGRGSRLLQVPGP